MVKPGSRFMQRFNRMCLWVRLTSLLPPEIRGYKYGYRSYPEVEPYPRGPQEEKGEMQGEDGRLRPTRSKAAVPDDPPSPWQEIAIRAWEDSPV